MRILAYNISKSIILCSALFFSVRAAAQLDEVLSGIKKVVIDPGHGGQDPGCHGSHSKEKEVTLAIGLKLGAAIEKKYPDIEVIYTRKTDVFIELDERAQIANRNNADLFICIHANAGPKTAFGAETYVLGLHKTDAQRQIAERENSAIEFEKDSDVKYEKLSADAIIARQLQLSVFLNHSIEFAARVQDQFTKLGRASRGVRQAGFLVLYKTTMPSVLIETGFLTNAEEEKFLSDSTNQSKMANSIFVAFEDYKKYYESADLSTHINVSEPADYGLDTAAVDPEKIVFRVQIATSSEALKTSDPQFMGMHVWKYENNNLHKYTVGIFDAFDEANKLKQQMRDKGFENAFVVAFMGSERVDIQKAIKMSQN
jgi:N-acetylmuramoyl-L-alanine amidase